MGNMFSLDFPYAYSNGNLPLAVFKKQPEDFVVVERLEDVPCEEKGEHHWLWVRKIGQNTEYVAKQLAKFAGVRAFDVGFSGLKDRWAVTEQWFSVYAPKKQIDWSTFELEGTEVLSHNLASRKLRRGVHKENAFKIVLRDLPQSSVLESRLKNIAELGVPNYFGPQRFGFQGENLSRGAAFFRKEIKASKSQRSFYISAARSYLFNLVLAEQVLAREWDFEGATCPLMGDEQEGVQNLSDAEYDVMSAWPDLLAGIHQNRLSMERRSSKLQARNFAWNWLDGDRLVLSFDLPTGCFATSLLRELCVLEDANQNRSKP